MKNFSIKFLIAALLLAFANIVGAQSGPYDENADARQQIQQALTQAASDHKTVIIVFGANWCGDCKMLEYAMNKGTSASLIQKDFEVVKVNIGRFDKNVDVTASYGVPLKEGIPAVSFVSPDNHVLYVTKEGELANARSMGDDGIYKFFKQVLASLPKK
jgi:protein disulfide-isomerase